jgi:predicted DCC family thiol-disulfide oxidoreductase YuxK
MKWLAVIYDDHCGLCSRLRKWLERRPVYVPLRLVPLHAPSLALRFPGIGAFEPGEQLVVVSDEGVVWRGDKAWIMVLWALREGREMAARLASPALRPLARKLVRAVSENRLRLSGWLGIRPEVTTRITPPNCAQGSCRTLK